MMKRTFSISEVQAIGEQLGVDFTKINLEQFRVGLSVELEHGRENAATNITDDDERLTGKIAWAHLREIPDYYTRLIAVEKAAGKQN